MKRKIYKDIDISSFQFVFFFYFHKYLAINSQKLSLLVQYPTSIFKMEYLRRIFRRVPVVNDQYQNYLLKNEEYLRQNKKEVLDLYRKFHKTIPKLFIRKIEKRAKIEELKYLFNENKNEQFISNIEQQKIIAKEVLEKIDNKEYPPFPTYYPDKVYNSNELEFQFRQRHNRELLI
ncbi:hypothetical protein ABPG74_015953 [Tetrahymena malaccensis]